MTSASRGSWPGWPTTAARSRWGATSSASCRARRNRRRRRPRRHPPPTPPPLRAPAAEEPPRAPAEVPGRGRREQRGASGAGARAPPAAPRWPSCPAPADGHPPRDGRGRSHAGPRRPGRDRRRRPTHPPPLRRLTPYGRTGRPPTKKCRGPWPFRPKGRAVRGGGEPGGRIAAGMLMRCACPLASAGSDSSRPPWRRSTSGSRCSRICCCRTPRRMAATPARMSGGRPTCGTTSCRSGA